MYKNNNLRQPSNGSSTPQRNISFCYFGERKTKAKVKGRKISFRIFAIFFCCGTNDRNIFFNLQLNWSLNYATKLSNKNLIMIFHLGINWSSLTKRKQFGLFFCYCGVLFKCRRRNFLFLLCCCGRHEKFPLHN